MDRRAIRLLYFVRESFPTHRVDVSVLFAEELPGRGHDIDLVMQAADAGTAPGARSWGKSTVWVGATNSGKRAHQRLHRKLLGFWHDCRMLMVAAKSQRYDAIQVRDKFVTGVMALLCARLRGLKFFFWLSYPLAESQILQAREGTSRNPRLDAIRGRVLDWLLHRVILPHCDHVFVQSERMRQNFVERGIEASKQTPVPMGIAARDIPDAVHTPAPFDRRSLTFGCLGALGMQRRMSVLIDTLAELRRRGVEARLILVGDGEVPQDRIDLENYARQLGVLPYMEITGMLPRSEAFARIKAVDVCVSPIFLTPVFLVASPTKLVEYLALGLPVVANDHPEQRQVLRESRAGVRVPWGARHFARAILWLSSRSPEQREEMARRGRRWVLENRTYTRIADCVEDAYLRLLFPAALPAVSDAET